MSTDTRTIDINEFDLKMHDLETCITMLKHHLNEHFSDRSQETTALIHLIYQAGIHAESINQVVHEQQ